MTLDNTIEQAARVLFNADALLITAGAGFSVDSGMPDFRGDKGFWKNYPPTAKRGLSLIQMANPKSFERDPELAWAFYSHLLNLYRKAIPHHGFLQLLEIARSKKSGYFVLTSNIDGQFQKAGYDEEKIAECHGSIHYLQCTTPCCRDIWDIQPFDIKIDEEAFEAIPPLPQCQQCGRIARPNVLMFSDGSWNRDRSRKQLERLWGWLNQKQHQKSNLAILEIGAGTSVVTIRLYSEQFAKKYNSTLIRINPREYEVPNGQIAIPLSGVEGIDRLVKWMPNR
ncbi:MAG: Sir2 family NAD-dependent protein deacetylase [Candidatus Parabeggiatoa sp.]|nr:Sir2 family NAD-dependent protein deacetylase [Candidatus Parabeggiatoa sp.]